MWHLFSDNRPWFAEKRFGYGSGLPIAWQGWVLLLSYVAVMIGLGAMVERGEALVGVIAGMLLATATLVAIARARTRGGWRWRRGEHD